MKTKILLPDRICVIEGKNCNSQTAEKKKSSSR
jgi:hypothetical protein